MMHIQGSKPGVSPLAELVRKVLMEVASTCPPEDAVALCTDIASTLTATLTRNAPASSPLQEPGNESAARDAVLRLMMLQMMQLSQQQELAHQTATAASQAAAAAWQQQTPSEAHLQDSVCNVASRLSLLSQTLSA